jgi:hypothetical protein
LLVAGAEHAQVVDEAGTAIGVVSRRRILDVD